MSEVWFYHLQGRPLERTLPVLVEKARERGWTAVIRAGSDERLAAIDDLLWTYDDASFLPHGLASDDDPQTQPVLLTTADERPNGAEIAFLIDNAPLPEHSAFTRIVMLFDGADPDAVAAARAAWKQAKADGHAVTYWQQDDAGRWTKKA